MALLHLLHGRQILRLGDLQCPVSRLGRRAISVFDLAVIHHFHTVHVTHGRGNQLAVKVIQLVAQGLTPLTGLFEHPFLAVIALKGLKQNLLVIRNGTQIG